MWTWGVVVCVFLPPSEQEGGAQWTARGGEGASWRRGGQREGAGWHPAEGERVVWRGRGGRLGGEGGREGAPRRNAPFIPSLVCLPYHLTLPLSRATAAPVTTDSFKILFEHAQDAVKFCLQVCVWGGIYGIVLVLPAGAWSYCRWLAVVVAAVQEYSNSQLLSASVPMSCFEYPLVCGQCM